MTRQIKIGLTLFAAILAVYVSMSWLRSGGFFAPKGNVYRVFFRNVNGLKTADPVTVFGYEAGVVLSFEPQTNGILVNIRLQPEVKVFTDATASILIKEILGGKQIDLRPGQSGQLLPPEKPIVGQSAYDFALVAEKMGRFFEEVDPQTFRRIVLRFDTLLARMAALDMEYTLRQANQSLNVVENAGTVAQRLMQAAERDSLPQQLAQTLTHFRQLSANANQALSQFGQLTQKIDTLAPQFSATLRQTQTALQQAQTLAEKLQEVLTRLDRKDVAAGALLNDPQFLMQINQTMTELQQALQLLRAGGVRLGINFSPKKAEKEWKSGLKP